MALLVGAPGVALAGGGCPEGYTPQDGFCKPYYGPNTRERYGYRGEGYRAYRYRDYDDDGYRQRRYRRPRTPDYFYR
jgi:hypothetical protein